MSIQAVGYVLEKSLAEGRERMVLVAFANRAGNDDDSSWVSVARLAKESRMSERTVQRALQGLEKAGRIERVKSGPHGTVVRRMVMPCAADIEAPERAPEPPDDGGRQIDGGDTTDVSHTPPVSPEPSRTVIAAAGASANERATVDVDALLARVQPLVTAGLIDDPRADGSDAALLTAAQVHGMDVVDAALDHIASWASDTRTKLIRRQLSAQLPSGIAHAKRGVRAKDGTPGDRPAFDAVRDRLTAAAKRSAKRDQLVSLLEERTPVANAAACLGVALDWQAWCNTSHEGYEGRQWLRSVAQTYRGLQLDLNVVVEQIDFLALNALRREAAAIGAPGPDVLPDELRYRFPAAEDAMGEAA